MGAHNAEYKRFLSEADVPDPGDTKTIRPAQNGVCRLVSTAAQTRTIADPDKLGQELWLNFMTDGGDITLTFSTAYTEAGETSYTFSDPGQFLFLKAVRISATALAWRKVSDSVLADSNSWGSPGVGISGGTGTIFKTSIVHSGGIIITSILIDLTGLNGGASVGDVIGTNGAGVAYLGQITTAKNGIVWGGRVMCFETPAGSNIDVDVWSADEATLVEDVAISSAANEVQLINHGNWAAGEIAGMTLVPLVNQYIYLTSGAATDATFTAGQFLIEFFGY